jgi:hypothetical protein
MICLSRPEPIGAPVRSFPDQAPKVYYFGGSTNRKITITFQLGRAWFSGVSSEGGQICQKRAPMRFQGSDPMDLPWNWDRASGRLNGFGTALDNGVKQ